jgi:hypothetical protein
VGRPVAGRRRLWVVVEAGGVIVSGLHGFEAVVGAYMDDTLEGGQRRPA